MRLARSEWVYVHQTRVCKGEACESESETEEETERYDGGRTRARESWEGKWGTQA